MYFKRIDPDSPASRGDLEALLGGQKEAHFWTEEVARDAAAFLTDPFESTRDTLVESCNRLIQARQDLRKVEESISPTPREGA